MHVSLKNVQCVLCCFKPSKKLCFVSIVHWDCLYGVWDFIKGIQNNTKPSALRYATRYTTTSLLIITLKYEYFLRLLLVRDSESLYEMRKLLKLRSRGISTLVGTYKRLSESFDIESVSKQKASMVQFLHIKCFGYKRLSKNTLLIFQS